MVWCGNCCILINLVVLQYALGLGPHLACSGYLGAENDHGDHRATRVLQDTVKDLSFRCKKSCMLPMKIPRLPNNKQNHHTLSRLVNRQPRSRSTILPLVARAEHIALAISHLGRIGIQRIGAPTLLPILHARPTVPLLLTPAHAVLGRHGRRVAE